MITQKEAWRRWEWIDIVGAIGTFDLNINRTRALILKDKGGKNMTKEEVEELRESLAQMEKSLAEIRAYIQ